MEQFGYFRRDKLTRSQFSDYLVRPLIGRARKNRHCFLSLGTGEGNITNKIIKTEYN